MSVADRLIFQVLLVPWKQPTVGRISSEASHNGTLGNESVPLWDTSRRSTTIAPVWQLPEMFLPLGVCFFQIVAGLLAGRLQFMV